MLREPLLTSFLVLMLVASIVLTVNSSLVGTLVIQNIGNIRSFVTARSGSPGDIQEAVDMMAGAGGGTVYIPEGNFSFDISPSHTWVNGMACGVIVPGGVNVLGAGGWEPHLPEEPDTWQSSCKTILRETQGQPYRGSPPNAAGSPMFVVDGYNGKPVCISGIYFQGFCDNEGNNNYGIIVFSTKDFRIDHCDFTDFGGTAIYTSTNYRQSYIMRGVIDHCNIDNPYKSNISMGDYTKRLWGYGIGCSRDDYTWVDNVDSIAGHYDDDQCVVFIEDCNLRRCRHEISANGGAHYVARHNNFTEMLISWYGSYCDAHGATGAPPSVGTRLAEIYDNTFIDSPTDYRSTEKQSVWGQYLGLGIGIRGGSAIIFNNTFKDNSCAVQLYSDATSDRCRPRDIYIWGNTYDSSRRIAVGQPTMDPLRAFGTAEGYTYDVIEGVHYFRYAKPGYVPYPYPHPLTLE